jgi:hypothetical protein
MDDGVGAGEIEAGAAGFQGDEENGDVGRGLETVDLGLAGAGRERAVEVTVGDFLRDEFLAEEREERGELGEDEEAVVVVDGLGEEFAERVEFRGVGETRFRVPRSEFRVPSSGFRG